jgi:predicted HicB family RNase H-like nuclease
MNKFLYRGYEGSIEYSDEDKCYCGEVLLPRDLVMYEGADVAELEIAFRKAVDDYLLACRELERSPDNSVD